MLYFIGGAGNGNFGDELILRGWLDYLTELGRAEDAVFDENSAGKARGLFGAAFPKLRFRDDISRLKRQGSDGFWASLGRGLKFFRNGGFERHPGLGHLDEVFRGLKVLHLHGGGFVNTIWPQNAFLLGFAAAVKAHYGCRVVGTGLGLMPAPEPGEPHRAGLRAAVEAFDLIELRDRWSYDYLRRHSASPRILLGLDDSYLIPRERQPWPGPALGPAPRPRTLHLSYFVAADRFEHALDIASGPGADRFERILFWSCTDRDDHCFERLAAVCPRAERIAWRDLLFGRIPVSPGDYMVTARFHPHLLAARHGAGGLYRADQGYYDVKHGSVIDLGSPFAAMGAPAAVPDEGTAPSLIHALDDQRVATKRRLAAYIYQDLLPGDRGRTGLPAAGTARGIRSETQGEIQSESRL